MEQSFQNQFLHNKTQNNISIYSFTSQKHVLMYGTLREYTINTFKWSELTFRASALIDHRAPGAGQLINVKSNRKFILGIGLQISHQEALLIPEE